MTAVTVLSICAAAWCAVGCSEVGPAPVLPPPDETTTIVTPEPEPPIVTEETTPVQQSKTATLTIVYDNNAPVGDSSTGLRTAWGFSCLIETTDAVVLFDTGGDGPTLMHNMSELGIDPTTIDIVVLSHFHSDHTGGLDALLDACTPDAVFVPQSFPATFKSELAQRTRVIEVAGPTDITPQIRSTGEMGSAIIEQALVIETGDGLALITGCAHPGIVDIATRAAKQGDLLLVLGGFHLKDSSDAQIASVIAQLQQLGVRRAAPTHCTGDRGRALFAKTFGEKYVEVGLGSVLVID